MPIKHAAVKQLRKDPARRARNQAVRAELRTLAKQLTHVLRAQRMDEARHLLQRVVSRYDRAAAKGIIHRNTAARSKSRLARRVAQSAPA